ncbi:MAG: DUF1840 domain-containing protein [Nitrosomonas sp.]
MLVTFTTDAHADITMFGEFALTFITMMGHSKTVPGAILAADVPMALARLRKAVDAEMTSHSAVNNEGDIDEEETNEPSVSLSNRALPLISLLSAAADAECDVMWK